MNNVIDFKFIIFSFLKMDLVYLCNLFKFMHICHNKFNNLDSSQQKEKEKQDISRKGSSLV